MNTNREPLDDATTNILRASAARIKRQGLLRHHDREDIESILFIHLEHQRHHFDPTRGTWEAFLWTIFTRKGMELFRLDAREPGPDRKQPPVSLDTVVGYEEDGSPTSLSETVPARMAAVVDEVALSMDFHERLASLPTALRRICLRLQTNTVAELCREMGIPRSTFDERYIYPLRKHFQRLWREK